MTVFQQIFIIFGCSIQKEVWGSFTKRKTCLYPEFFFSCQIEFYFLSVLFFGETYFFKSISKRKKFTGDCWNFTWLYFLSYVTWKWQQKIYNDFVIDTIQISCSEIRWFIWAKIIELLMCRIVLHRNMNSSKNKNSTKIICESKFWNIRIGIRISILIFVQSNILLIMKVLLLSLFWVTWWIVAGKRIVLCFLIVPNTCQNRNWIIWKFDKVYSNERFCTSMNNTLMSLYLQKSYTKMAECRTMTIYTNAWNE